MGRAGKCGVYGFKSRGLLQTIGGRCCQCKKAKEARALRAPKVVVVRANGSLLLGLRLGLVSLFNDFNDFSPLLFSRRFLRSDKPEFLHRLTSPEDGADLEMQWRWDGGPLVQAHFTRVLLSISLISLLFTSLFV